MEESKENRRESLTGSDDGEATATEREEDREEVPWKRLGFEWFCYFSILIRVFM